MRLEFLVALESLPHSGLLQLSSGSSVIAKFPMSSGSSVIANTTCLEILKIEECATLLDLKIGELPALKRLAVEDGNYRLRQLPISIGCLANLQHLALGGGCVTQNVWNFAMTELPEDIGRLVNLKAFELYSMFAIKKLPDAFSTLTRLECLLLQMPGCISLANAATFFCSKRKCSITCWSSSQ